MRCKKVVPVPQVTPPAPAVVVPASPVIPKAAPVPPPAVKSPASPKQDDAKPLPSVKPTATQQLKKMCVSGIDQVETNRMISKGIKNPDGSQLIVCNI